ncbi:MAG: hypothetical protein CVU97_07375 [Firmicutes bacterium HGW-Firmicutes-21]|nr:MAG: hypothetical protein CVU97_07375 [Firmicutes bacterium HGW-Firmicutes-21]
MEATNKFLENNKYYIRTVVVALLAFLGTYYALPARGLISMIPFLLVAVLFSVLIKIPIWQKAALFGLFALIFATVEIDYTHGIGFAALCILMVIFCSLAFYLLRKKKILPAIISILLISACAVPHAYFFGNIIKGLDADRILAEYIDERYTSEDTIISETYYDYKHGYYKANIYEKKRPTEIYSLTVINNYLYDSYRTYAEKQLMNRRMLDITSVLRDNFKSDKFEVIPLNISGYPFKSEITINDTNDYNSLMSFRIVISGQLDKDSFTDKAKRYYDTIMDNDIDFKKIVFVSKGTTNTTLRISVTTGPFMKDFPSLLKPPAIYGIDNRLFAYLNQS